MKPLVLEVLYLQAVSVQGAGYPPFRHVVDLVRCDKHVGVVVVRDEAAVSRGAEKRAGDDKMGQPELAKDHQRVLQCLVDRIDQ